MKLNEEQVRAAIADQAGEWFVANDAGPLDVPDAAALAEWLKSLAGPRRAVPRRVGDRA